MKKHFLAMPWLGAIAFAFTGCNRTPPAEPDTHSSAEPAAAPSNRVDIPETVRTNLGITFARVERRDVASTLRVPGRFELLPSARREHRTPLAGSVDLLVKQYQRVARGEVLYRLDAPGWRDLQRELADTQAALDVAQARVESFGPIMEAHRMHEQGLREAVELWSHRVKQLEELGAAGGGRAGELAEAIANLTAARASFGEVMEKDAELQRSRLETQSELRSATTRLALLERSAAALAGHVAPMAPAESGAMESGGGAFWRDAAIIEVRAAMDGVIEQMAITNGGWAEQGELVLSIVDPGALRFRGIGLQSDLGRLKSGLDAAIVAPSSTGVTSQAAMPATLEIGLDADPAQRTIELLAMPSAVAPWARPGVSAFLEIAVESTAAPELAIPQSAVVRDGLTPIIFRRDPANPNKAVRIEADLGINDGRWIVIHSGVREGDEVVLDGVYQLLLATASSAPKGGHFHADGTFHAGDDE